MKLLSVGVELVLKFLYLLFPERQFLGGIAELLSCLFILFLETDEFLDFASQDLDFILSIQELFLFIVDQLI